MVKTDIKKLRESNENLYWFVIKAITKHAEKTTGDPMFTSVDGWNENLGNNMNIKYSIDDVELDFISCWKDYEEAWDRGVMKQAKELIEDKTWDVFDGIRDKANKLEKYLKKKIDELFPDLVDENDY